MFHTSIDMINALKKYFNTFQDQVCVVLDGKCCYYQKRVDSSHLKEVNTLLDETHLDVLEGA